MTKKIFITGGHVTPALAVIDALSSSDVNVLFIGRKYAMEGESNVSAEYTLIHERGIPFLSILAGRLQRSFTLRTIPSLLKIPIGFGQAFGYCLRQRPDLIVSFGGYVALPVAIAGAFFGIPILTHEQTLSPGLANRLIALLARRICVTFAETAPMFSEKKVVITGLPLRSELFSSGKPAAYDVNEKRYPLLYITGGSLGAQSLNRTVFQIIFDLTKQFTVIHQVGNLSLGEAKEVQSALPKDQKSRYIVESYIPASSVSWVLGHARIVIGRSGANTTLELAALGKVALLVPLPWSAGNEQELHAQWLAKYGGAYCIRQHEATGDTLLAHVRDIWKHRQSLQKRATAFALQVPRDGAKRVADQIALLLG